MEICRKFISVESTPTTGNVEIAKLAAEYCRGLGLQIDFQEGVISGVAQMNVIARAKGQGATENEIMFQTHLDTVEPGIYSMWTETDRNPFNGSIRDGKIYGLGASNSKLDYVCKLWAIKELGSRDWKRPFVLVGTYGEESGMLGAKKLIQSRAVKCRYAVVGEPTGLQLVTACNGIAVLDFFVPFDEDEKNYRIQHSEAESTSTHSRIFRGKAAHSSTPEFGENAIMKAIRYLEELPESIAILTVDGGTFHNIVPNQAYVEVDMSRTQKNGAGRRLLKLVRELENLSTEFVRFSEPNLKPPTPTLNYGVVRTYEDGLQLIASLRMTPSVRDQDLQGWRGRIREFCQQLGIRFRLRDFKLPWRVEEESRLVQESQGVLKSLNLHLSPMSKTTTNESSVYSQEGIECVVFGAGTNVGTDYGPNECNKIEDLKKATEFYKHLLERMCL